MNTNTAEITNKSAFDVIRAMPGINFTVTESAVKTARSAFKSAHVKLPTTKDGGEMSDELLVAMGSAVKIARNVDDGLTRLSYLVGASVLSNEWESLYPIVTKDGKPVTRSKPFKNSSEFISYMLPDTARSTALNYVSAVVNVLLPAKMGQLPELPECADMSIGMASNIKSAIIDKEIKPALIKEVEKLHKEKGNDTPLTRAEWKSAIANAKEAIGKSKPRDTSNVTGANAEESTVTIHATAQYYAILDALNIKAGVVPDNINNSKAQMDKFRNLVNAAYKSTDAAMLFLEALHGAVNGANAETDTVQ